MKDGHVSKVFKSSAANHGITDFEMKGNDYVNPDTQRAWMIFVNGLANMYDSTSNGYVIGTVVSTDGERRMTFSDKPVVHSGIKSATAEARRLSRKVPGSIFAVLSYMSCYKDGREFDPKYRGQLTNIKRKSFRYADDGFGNLIRVNRVTTFLAYKNIFGGENMNAYNARQYRWAGV